MAVQKQFIIKADDYGRRGANLDSWRRFIDCALNEYLTLSVGVVGFEFTQNKAVPLYLRSIVEEYGIEVWNHSNKHPNFTALNQAQIENEILESQKIISNELGATPTIFGPPFNKIDVASANHVINLDVFKGFYAFDGLIAPGKNIELKYFSGVEIGTDKFRPMRLDVFESQMVRRGWPDFLVLQLHPYYWSTHCLDVFKSVLRILKDNSYICLNAEQRINYWSKKVVNDNQIEIGRTLADNILYEEALLDRNEKEINLKRLRSEFDDQCEHCLIVREASSSEILQFYISLGFQGAPRFDGHLTVLDTGKNSGSWGATAKLLKNSKVISINLFNNKDQRRIEDDGFEKNNINTSTSVTDTLQSGYFSIILCDKISNLNIFSEFEFFWEKLAFSGMLLIGIENRLLPLRNSIELAKKGDYENSLLFLNKLVVNEGKKAGLVKESKNEYWNESELSEIAISCGLKLQRKNISLPGIREKLCGHDLYSGSFFIKTTAAENIKKKYRDGVLKINNINMQFIDIGNDVDRYVLDIKNILAHNDEAKSFESLIKDQLVANNFLYKKRMDQVGLYLNCFSNLDISELPLKLNEDNLHHKITLLYRAIKRADHATITASISDIENYFLSINTDELSYWI
jgi:hypothetical protein